MRNSWLLLLVMAMSLAGFAQVPGGGGGRRGGFGGGQAPSIGHFYGKVVDTKTNKGIDGVSIQLIGTKFDTVTKSRKDTVISGMITRRSGEFSLENLPIFGQFRLVITAIGYKTYDQKVAFDLKGLRGGGAGAAGGAEGEGQPGGNMGNAINAVDKDLGNIKMVEDAQSLEQVTVTASKPLIQMGVDRKIYNVEKDISAQGGTGVDIMKNVPSLQVDIDGNVTLRNSSPTIFVDGRPSTLTLDQIPADAIQSVEIITNPGAKYDASGGTAGILNIVLKKNRKAGYNGSIRAGIDMRGKFNIGGDLNVKQGKINFFINANYNQRKSISNGTTDRYTFFGNPADSLHQYDHNVSNNHFMFGRAGLDFLIDNRNTISLSGNIVHGESTPTTSSDLTVDDLFPSGTTYSQTFRNSSSKSNFNNHGAMLSYKHTFPKAGEELTADVNYSQGANDNTNLIVSDIHNIKGQPTTSTYQQRQTGNGDNKYFTGQIDYTLPLGEKSKFEAGGRAQIRNNTSLNNI
ncbi:MAG: outer membrane beta-barrel protein, partial [Bacteroidetes bacterium]|nr:outer membrane beta-barrel protein [Bacteroidota bacterium]